MSTCEDVCNEAYKIMNKALILEHEVYQLESRVQEYKDEFLSDDTTEEDRDLALGLYITYRERVRELTENFDDLNQDFDNQVVKCRECLSDHKLDENDVDFMVPDEGDFDLVSDLDVDD